jgi:hypothetical protein
MIVDGRIILKWVLKKLCSCYYCNGPYVEKFLISWATASCWRVLLHEYNSHYRQRWRLMGRNVPCWLRAYSNERGNSVQCWVVCCGSSMQGIILVRNTDAETVIQCRRKGQVPGHAKNTCWRSGGIALRILNHGISWKWVVISASRPSVLVE